MSNVNYIAKMLKSKFPNILCRYLSKQAQQNACVEPVTRVYSPKLEKLKAKQAMFQLPNNVPVYLKNGKKDVVLFRTTVGLLCYNIFCTVKQMTTYM